jgi:hypothetical protein
VNVSIRVAQAGAEDVWIPCQMLRKDLDRVVKVEAMEPSYGVVRFVVTVLLMALVIVVLKNFFK